MASLRKFPHSRYWFACISLPSGKRVQRSTKEFDRKKAMKIADQWEELARGKARAKQFHQVVADVYREVHNVALPQTTVRSFLGGFLERRKAEIKRATFLAYEQRCRHFLQWLGPEADSALNELESDQILRYREHLRNDAGLSAKTVNNALKSLRVFFADAAGTHMADNPAAAVKTLPMGDRTQRQAFTVEQLRLILEAASPEWRSMVLFGAFTGLRLADVATLKWSNVDLVRQELRRATRKTGRNVVIPLHPSLVRHLAALPVAGRADAPLHPHACRAVEKDSVATLSGQFASLLASVGLIQSADRVSHRKSSGKGRGAARGPMQLSFHSLRVFFVSALKAAGAGESVAMDLAGHESREVSAHYTRTSDGQKRAAVAGLPEIIAND